jgi:hypothetical protein
LIVAAISISVSALYIKNLIDINIRGAVLLALKSIDLYRGDLYQEVLVEIDISRQGRYLIQCRFGDRELETIVNL